METKNIHSKKHHLIATIAGIWLIFSCISLISAFNEESIYDLWAQQTLQANNATKKQNYQEALQLISGTTSEDYYNRATIETLLAYQNALQNDLSWLQNAQTLVTQAQQNFAIAKELSNNPTTTKAIITNQESIASLSTVVDIKTCYGIGETIISSIGDITNTIKNIKETLNQADIIVTKKANNIDTVCYQKLRYIIDTSKQQVGMLQLQMDKNKTKYLTDLSDKIQEPIICIQTPYDNIIPSLIKGKQWLESYQQQHQNTIDALTSNDKTLINELCNQSKNDAQINQQIESSVQELLQKLDENTTQEKEKTKSSQKIQYKDFFGEDEQKALQNIQKTSETRIDAILKTRGKPNYTPQRYIDEMFNQFYGNSGDFINLHK